MLLLALAGSGTAVATGAGAVPVFLLGTRVERFRPMLLGVTIGLMGVASIVGLLLPALDEGRPVEVAAGGACGTGFLMASRRWLGHHDVHVRGLRGVGARSALLVFAVLFVHSLPEGLAIGTAYSSDTEGLGVFVILAIALQNAPEGTSVSIPMASAGFARGEQFWGAVLTSAPQPFGAVLAFLLVEQVAALLPFSFAFAAGAMLSLVVAELAPQAFTREGWRGAAAGAVLGGAAMLGLAAVLGV